MVALVGGSRFRSQSYQTEIPEARVQRIEFRIHLGRCRRCRRPVQGRHPRQTSQAVGSAASQLGPRALALAAVLNKQLGLPYGKTVAVLAEGESKRSVPGFPANPPIRPWWSGFVPPPA